LALAGKRFPGACSICADASALIALTCVNFPGRGGGRKQWHYGATTQELEARLKAQQHYEQPTGAAQSSLGTAFWELRFQKV
jgi:hypothetical protein